MNDFSTVFKNDYITGNPNKVKALNSLQARTTRSVNRVIPLFFLKYFSSFSTHSPGAGLLIPRKAISIIAAKKGMI